MLFLEVKKLIVELETVVNVKGLPLSVQLGQLDPIVTDTATVPPTGIIGPENDASR
jgi:hypothetical protein